MTEENQNSTNRSRRSRRYRGKRMRDDRPRRARLDNQESFREESTTELTEVTKIQVAGKVVAPLLWSLLLTVFSLANPLLTNFATNLQTQNLYAGLAMHAGQAPYLNFVGADGVLYYLIVYAGTFFGTTIGLALLQLLALTLTGDYMSKIFAYFSDDDETTRRHLAWFYLLAWALGFGGLYATIFALPFMAATIWFLVKYFQNAIRDEAFIRFGFYLAAGCLIEPSAIIFWIVAGIGLVIYNIRQKRKARGFYQFLASLLGFLALAYLVGYYIFDSQIVAFLIPQSIGYGFLAMNFTRAAILNSLFIILIALLITGFFQTILQSLIEFSRDKEHRTIKAILLVSFFVQLLFMIGARYFEVNQLLLLLPGMMTLAVSQTKVVEYDADGREEVEHKSSYLKNRFYIPLLVLIAIPLYPLSHYFLNQNVIQEREQVATVINRDKKENEKIYTWDSNASIYLQTQLTSVSRVINPEPFLDVERNQVMVAYNLGQNNAQYIVINKQMTVPTDVMENIRENYEQVNTGTNILTLYRRK